MNDFLKTMSQLGLENIGYDGAEMTLEEEMNAEIAMEAELDNAYEQAEFASIVAGTSQAEAMLTAMAEREVGLESNSGRDASSIYAEFGLEGFGMEAVKDVIARKAYSGLASLKALINTCISWLKQLVGISVSAKKVFSGIAKKAKAMDKNLRKVANKVSEKLKRDMPKYNEVLNKILSEAYKKAQIDNIGQRVETLKNETDAANLGVKDIKKASEDLNDTISELSEMYDKGDTDEYEGNACYNHILTNVGALKTAAENEKKEDSQIKTIEDRIKDLEKLRKEIDKKDNSSVKQPDALAKWINAVIAYLTKLSNYKKKALKLYVRVADDCLTMGKSIYAALV